MRLLIVMTTMAAGLLLAGCGSDPTRDEVSAVRPEAGTRTSRLTARASRMAISTVGYQVPTRRGDFTGNPAVERFVGEMQRKHGLDRAGLERVLARAQREQWIIDAMDRPVRKRAKTGPNGSWNRYRAKFITSGNIDKGVRFWRSHAADLQRASAQYGVPPEIIVGIIGVETRWGRIMGKTRIIDALATLAFAYPRRSAYFTDELEGFLIMSRDEGFDPFGPRGSFAGAMGYGQFMPSSFHRYAVDFDGDHHRDLWSPTDAIGSIANYFKGHGWRSGEPVAVRAASVRSDVGLETGFKTSYSLHSLAGNGIRPLGGSLGTDKVSLLGLDVGSGYEYWLGMPNFYVITRYNHSTYYAMAVWQLGNAVRSRIGATGSRVAGQGARGTDLAL